tara:strand:- start:30 stop:575 length:546 start_codon:yes stop_codon:yes gene_type:complete
MDYKIIDSFLDKEHYLTVSSFLKSKSCPYYFEDSDTYKDSKNKNGFFSFCYYNNNRPDHSLFDNHIVPILKKLNYFSCVQVRANLSFRDKDSIECGIHTDYDAESLTTAILFLTKSNAKTILYVDDKPISIDNLENRILIFPSYIKHKVIYQTDVHKRYVINFNYFENPLTTSTGILATAR